jgi:hypothetical protein
MIQNPSCWNVGSRLALFAALSLSATAVTAQTICPVVPPSAPRWSDPATWNGVPPTTGARIVIPVGRTILLDTATPSLASLVIEGALIADPNNDVAITAESIMVSGGRLEIGTEAQPYLRRATITLAGSDPAQNVMGMGTKVLGVLGGGRVSMFGRAPNAPWAKLNAHANTGATSLTLDRTVDWRAGDQIVVAPTEWYPYGAVNRPQAEQDAMTTTELRTVTSVAGVQLGLATGLSQSRWGRMQYVTDNGLSLSPGTFTKPHPDAVAELDERAEVGNITRNIVIQGEDSTAWRNNGFGGHVMIMDLASSFKLDSVELRRMGQAGVVGRYPIHWHLLSYDVNGRELGDATEHFVRNSSIWDSRQRCLVIHGTNGVKLQNNICYDIRGHAIFIEDAVERRNIIEGNLVLKVRSPINSLAVTAHEKSHFCGAAAGYWLTNPDNTVRNNAVADAQGNGFWLSYPRFPVKQGKLVPIRPNNLIHAPFEFNSARSNGNAGVMLECGMKDDAGNLELLQYQPTVDGGPYTYNNGVPFVLRGISTIKNRTGYVNRTIRPQYRQWTASGNLGRAFTGAVFEGSTLMHSLIIGSSLNNATPYPPDAEPQLGVASYHSTMDIAQNTFVNLPNRGFTLTRNGGDISSGAFGTDDYYLIPVEKGFWRNPGNKLINSDPGYHALPPHMQPTYTPATNNNWTLAGAVWDPHGYWNTSGRWLVLDATFLRDASCTPLLTKVPANNVNGLSCAGPYFGVNGFHLNRGMAGETNPYSPLETMDVERQDAAGNLVGRWRVEQGYTSNFFGNMRHFAAVRNGVYVLRFPEFPNASSAKSPPKWINVSFSNVTEAADSFLLGVHFDGASTPSRVVFSTNPDYADASNTRALTVAANRGEVANGTFRYWQDRANNLVWVRVTPTGLNAWGDVTPGSDADLYRMFSLRIEP